jgi:RND superfamily putative drug exporter
MSLDRRSPRPADVGTGGSRPRPGPRRLPSWRIGKWLVLACWVIIAAALVPLAQQLTSVETNDNSAWLPRSAEATMAYDRALAAFPDTKTIPAVVVYARDGGLTPADRARAEADRQTLASLAWHGQASPLIPAEDGSAVLFTVPLDGAAGWDGLPDSVDAIKNTTRSGATAGLQTGVAGPAAMGADSADAFGGLDSTLLLASVGVVALILLGTYRSPVLWLVPLVSVGIASQLASAVVYLLARYAGLTVNGQSAGILTVLVFGAGTDYALLLVARYREELRRHLGRHEAMGVALRQSLPAIVASGTTVILGMLCLLAAQMNSTRGLGPVAAVGIGVALLVMTTLLPALLVICGRWLFWPFVPRFDPAAIGSDATTDHGLWARITAVVGRRSRMLWVATTLIVMALAAGSLTFKIGMTQQESFTTTVSSVTAQHLLDRHFPSGSSGPATIYATAPTAPAVADAARAVNGVASVTPPKVSPDGAWVAIDAVLRDAPDSAAAGRTVERLRTAVHAVDGSRALVGGATAIQLDIDHAVTHDNQVVMPLILIVVFLVLVLLLRALVAPVVLMASVVVSFLGAMGAAALILKALGHSHIDRSLPLFGFLFLVALGVDYTIFLMSRAREETLRIGHRDGTLRALTVTGGVITSAGLVLAATFAALAVLPLTFMLQLGMIVAVGVLLDTLVVRTLLVPALALDLGARTWWPSRLAADPAGPAPAAGPAANEPVGAPAGH